MTSASHAEGRQFDPGQVYDFATLQLAYDQQGELDAHNAPSSRRHALAFGQRAAKVIYQLGNLNEHHTMTKVILLPGFSGAKRAAWPPSPLASSAHAPQELIALARI